MCGIAVLYHPTGLGRGAAADVQTMVAAVSNRGPDYSNVFVDESIAIGHARLSILDLSDAAHQPMQIGDLVLAYNGEIFNWEELRRELANEHRTEFLTQSDTEVLLQAYRVWGKDCVRRFNGMFAFVVWDRRRRELFAARDRLGVKPLYLMKEADGTLGIASEPRAFWTRSPLGEHLDREAVALCLGSGFYPGGSSGDRRIESFPSGTTMVWREGSQLEETYWTVWEHDSIDLSFPDAVEAADMLLRDAIRLRLRADVPTGLFLSGGMDSSLVAAIAREEAGKELEAFSINVENSPFDERKYAELVSRTVGIRLHRRTLDRSTLEELPQIVWGYGDMFGDSSALPTYFIAQKAASRLKVVLSGDGGDEAFGGYVVPFAAHVAHYYSKVPRVIRRGLRAASRAIDSPRLPLPLRWASRMNEMSLLDIDQVYSDFMVQTVWGRDKRAFRAEYEEQRWGEAVLHPSAARLSRASVLRHAETRDRFQNDYLLKFDRGTMIHSIEGRAPLLDFRLIEFGLGLKDRVVYHGWRRKAILRRMCVRRFGREFVNRRKVGFSVPIGQWMIDPEYWQSIRPIILRDSALWEIMHRDSVVRAVSKFERSPQALAARIWSVLWCQIWLGLYHDLTYKPEWSLRELAAVSLTAASRGQRN